MALILDAVSLAIERHPILSEISFRLRLAGLWWFWEIPGPARANCWRLLLVSVVTRVVNSHMPGGSWARSLRRRERSVLFFKITPSSQI